MPSVLQITGSLIQKAYTFVKIKCPKYGWNTVPSSFGKTDNRHNITTCFRMNFLFKSSEQIWQFDHLSLVIKKVLTYIFLFIIF